MLFLGSTLSDALQIIPFVPQAWITITSDCPGSSDGVHFAYEVAKMRDLETIPEPFRGDLEKAIEVVRAQGAEEVYVFGSLVDPWLNQLPRDIDIAVSGLPPEKFFHTYGLLLGELNHPFDLIDLDDDSRFVRKLRERGRIERVA